MAQHATRDDLRFMRRALVLARRGAGHVAPNPLVGAVVVRDDRIIGEGYHARPGGDHAEVVALREAGARARGATMYVSLEPCNHQGKTPPCTTAILNAGISRVVYAIADPNPVAAGGADALAHAGVVVASAVGATEATDLNASFIFAARYTDRPFVTLKLALSIDGALVDASRARGWLTGRRARAAVHVLRAGCDAVAVGIGTVLADDPELTVRDVPSPRIAPKRVVFDRGARTPLTSAVVKSARDVPLIVVTDGHAAAREHALREQGAQIVHADSLAESLRSLRQRDIRHLLVEGGAHLASAFLAAGAVDRLITFQAPVILGAGALPAFVSLPTRLADEAPRYRVVERRVLGADLMTTYAVSGDQAPDVYRPR